MRACWVCACLVLAPLLALAVINAVAAQQAYAPPFRCEVLSGCLEDFSPEKDIGNGAVLSTPAGWRTFHFPVPPQPKGLSTVRIIKAATTVAIEGFPNLDNRIIEEAWLKSLLEEAVAPYLPVSKEGKGEYVSIGQGDMVGGCIGLTAAPGSQPFHVLPGIDSASVKACILYVKKTIFSISIESELENDPNVNEATEFIRAIS